MSLLPFLFFHQTSRGLNKVTQRGFTSRSLEIYVRTPNQVPSIQLPFLVHVCAYAKRECHPPNEKVTSSPLLVAPLHRTLLLLLPPSLPPLPLPPLARRRR